MTMAEQRGASLEEEKIMRQATLNVFVIKNILEFPVSNKLKGRVQ